MQLLPLRAFSDNYIWMVHDGRQALVVDPGDSGPVITALDSLGLTLAAILVTHHHPDHVGGVDALRGRLQGPVYAPADETTPEPHVSLWAGDEVKALGLSFKVMDVPGHTAGHIAYFMPAQSGQSPLVFCGDTLFSGGCGRLFEGTAAQMHRSLSELAALPGETRVCCAHEYTLSNLKFAVAVEPGNRALLDYAHWCREQRDQDLPTLPSTIERERAINPFLRCAEPEVQASAHSQGCRSTAPHEVLGTLREWKNRF